MSEILNHIDLSKHESLKECSLYQAIRWIAFKEKPLKHSIAKLIYPFYNLYSDKASIDLSPYVSGNMLLAEEAEYPELAYPEGYYENISDERVIHEESFNNARIALLASLINSDIKAYGSKGVKLEIEKARNVKNELGWLGTYKITELHSEVSTFDLEYGKIYWYDNCIETTDLDFTSIRIANIHFSTKELSNLFPDIKKTQSKRTGRPTFYKWDEFYIALSITFYEDGIPKEQAVIEKKMAEWCDKHWTRTPAESVIRERVKPYYKEFQKLTKADKS